MDIENNNPEMDEELDNIIILNVWNSLKIWSYCATDGAVNWHRGNTCNFFADRLGRPIHAFGLSFFVC